MADFECHAILVKLNLMDNVLVEAFGFNKNNIRSEESMEQSTLSTDNFVVAKSLLNDNREVINSANT
ncbi:hypothetical protein GLOIN_2v1768727 [Rhizophagus irregularis DAOM 181602=DAOM 197198]|nr:hypothetical protein GLOIN_2v1768727 [Rhizophagus irregularis DAOM 181602=DAOM 197198]